VPAKPITPFKLYLPHARSKTYYFSFSKQGKLYRFNTGETDEAKAGRVAQEHWLRHSSQVGEEGFDPVNGGAQDAFDKYIQSLQADGRNTRTLDNYDRYIEDYFEYFGPGCLGQRTEADFVCFRDWLLKQPLKSKGRHHATNTTLSEKSVAERINFFASVFKYYQLPNPCARVARPRKSHAERQESLEYFSREEMKILFSKVGKTFGPTFRFLAYTGCRIGELASLTRNSIDESTKTIWVVGKGSKRRKLTLSGAGEQAWNAMLEEIKRHPDRETIFHPNTRWYWHHMQYLCQISEIPHRGPHAIRHTFATHALQYWGWDLFKLSKWLGHETIDTTARFYGHFVPEPPVMIEY
jgi:integrase